MEISRRKALLGVATSVSLYSGLINSAKSANTSGWNPLDKDAGISITNIVGLGANSCATNVSTNGWSSVRSVQSFSSGLRICTFVSRNLYNTSNGGARFGFGIANSSASLSTYIGADNNGCGVISNQPSNGLYYYAKNGVLTMNPNGATLAETGGSIGQIAVNMSGGTPRAHVRMIYGHNFGTGAQGWHDFAGNTSDPTNTSQGTDISSLGTPIYFTASLLSEGGVTPADCLLFIGGWPDLSEMDTMSYPSGFAPVDPAYPFNMPSGVYKFSGVEVSPDLAISQNGMRAYTTVTSPSSGTIYGPVALPASSKVGVGFFVEGGTRVNEGSTSNGGVGMSAAGGTHVANTVYWRADGTMINLSVTGLPSYRSGDWLYWLINRVTNKLWLAKNDFGTIYGNAGAGADPSNDSTGISISGVTGVADWAPAAVLSITRQAFTLNAGKLADRPTLPSGFAWPEDLVSGSRRAKGQWL